MPAYVQAPKRKLDSVDASAAPTSSKHMKISSVTSTSIQSTSSSSQAAPQPKPSVWGQGGNSAADLFKPASQRPAKPLVAAAIQPKPAALPKSSVWGQPAKPLLAVPLAKTATAPSKVESTLNPSCQVFQPTPRKALNPSCQVFQPASPGETLISFKQQVQPTRSISPANSGTSGTSSSTTTSSTSWRSQSSATSASSFASQSSWRSQSSASSAFSCSSRSSWRSNASKASYQPRNSVQVGQICFIPRQADIAAGEPIHVHPDFISNSNAFNHPCVVAEGPDDKGYVTCFQLTSFGNYQGLLDKYADKGTQSMASQRIRWLLIECGGKAPNHDNLPILNYDSACSGSLPKTTYVNCEKWFKIRPSDLVIQGKTKNLKLSMGSVQDAWYHHEEVLEVRYGVMAKALEKCPGLMP